MFAAVAVNAYHGVGVLEMRVIILRRPKKNSAQNDC
jgi:hypothetical protein